MTSQLAKLIMKSNLHTAGEYFCLVFGQVACPPEALSLFSHFNKAMLGRVLGLCSAVHTCDESFLVIDGIPLLCNELTIEQLVCHQGEAKNAAWLPYLFLHAESLFSFYQMVWKWYFTQVMIEIHFISSFYLNAYRHSWFYIEIFLYSYYKMQSHLKCIWGHMYVHLKRI